MKKIKYFLECVFWIIALPVVLIVMYFSLPKDFWEKYDEHRSAEDEMFGF